MGPEFVFLFVIIVVAAVISVAMYLGGAALWKGKTDPEGDTIEGDIDQGAAARPKHVVTGRPTKARFVPSTDESADREDVRGGS